MKISIITVCYNSAKTIEKTFNSVANQTYKNIEYIVVDGGSKDETLELIQNHQSTITKYISEKDNGLYDAMNKGIKMATGDYIGIINSDDTLYSSDVIERVVDFLQQNPVDASIGNIIQHDEKGEIKRTYSSENWLPKKLKIGFMPPHPSIFFKRSLFEEYGYYQLDFKIAADYELIIRYFLSQEITWKYSGITTTAMLVGGLSSSGWESYKKVTEEINTGLQRNAIPYSAWKVSMRGFWKVFGLLK
jgi:glycosyltransferase involved in cell wall biosynthesis